MLHGPSLPFDGQGSIGEHPGADAACRRSGIFAAPWCTILIPLMDEPFARSTP